MADQPEMESQEASIEERMLENLDIDDEVEAEEVEAEETEIEPEEADEEGESEAEIEAVENEVINIDGEEYEVPVPLKDAFMRQQDYTKKTQELATQRKALEEQINITQQQAQFQQLFQEQVGQISALDAQLKQYEAVNWQELQNSDPVQFVALREQYRDLKDARNYYSKDLSDKQQQQALQSQQHYAKLKEQGIADLRNSIKGWGEETARAVKSFGTETYGFNEAELASIIDPRMVKVLHDAMLYRKGVSASNKKVIGKPQLGKPKATTSQAKQSDIKLRQALKKTGKQDYATRAIEALL